MMGFIPLKFSPLPGQRKVSLELGAAGTELVGRAQRSGDGVGEQEFKLINFISPLIFSV